MATTNLIVILEFVLIFIEMLMLYMLIKHMKGMSKSNNVVDNHICQLDKHTEKLDDHICNVDKHTERLDNHIQEIHQHLHELKNGGKQT